MVPNGLKNFKRVKYLVDFLSRDTKEHYPLHNGQSKVALQKVAG